MNGIDEILILQLLGIAFAGAFAGEAYRCAHCANINLRQFLFKMLSSVFLSFLIGLGYYNSQEDGVVSVILTGILAYQEPQTLQNFIKNMALNWINREEKKNEQAKSDTD